MMGTLIDIFADMPSDDLVCVTPENRLLRRELLAMAMDLRDSGVVLANPVVTGDNINLALAYMIALEGYASAMYLVPAGIDDSQRNKICELAKTVTMLKPGSETQWILSTSGTTGTPKLVSHTFNSLTRSCKRNSSIGSKLRWALMYDVCRFAGLQVALQACITGSVLLVAKVESTDKFIDFLELEGCTSVSATPSLWRKLLYAAPIQRLNLAQITLGGEIADERILLRLRQMFPHARITHIYASTEAGVGFSVKDGKAGFPAEYLTHVPGSTVKLKISAEGCLLISDQNFNQYYVDKSQPLSTMDGYINTGDKVEIRGDRIYFLGRANGAINVGGQKVMPEEVEGVLLGCQDVIEVRVYGKPNPVLGTVVVAEVVPHEGATTSELKKHLNILCQNHLDSYKRPAIIRFVGDIEITRAGKMKRDIR